MIFSTKINYKSIVALLPAGIIKVEVMKMKEINIGKMIITKRKEKGITQDELAAYMGVSKASVSKWETGGSLR